MFNELRFPFVAFKDCRTVRRLNSGGGCLKLVGLLIVSLALLQPANEACGQGMRAQVSAGGPYRVQRGKWALVKGGFANTGDEDREVLAVVMPHGAGGVQYGRRLVIPAHCARSSQWPVWVPDQAVKVFEFDYLIFEDPDNERSIKRVAGDTVTRSFSVANPEALNGQQVGFRGLLSSSNESRRDSEALDVLTGVLREEAGYAAMGLPFSAEQIDGYPEALESLAQLVITSQTVHHFPEACDAVRVWTQRGGRTWLLLDQCGVQVAQAILGESLPLTYIDETSSNQMTFEKNPEFAGVQDTERLVEREFEEPVRMVRVLSDAGKTLWTVDGWPAVIELTLGQGTVMLTTVAPEAYVQRAPTTKSLPNARPLFASLFELKPQIVRITDQQLQAAAAGSIGYEVPSRFFAATIMLGFAVCLAGCGVWLLRKDRATSLLWLVPVLALVCALPAVWQGGQSRSVAPPTAIQQQLTEVVPGSTTLAADGMTSVFQPAPATLDVAMHDFAILTPSDAGLDRGQRRIVWTDRGESEWHQLQQDAGIRNYVVRSLARFDKPQVLKMTLDQNGLVGNPRDVAFSGDSDLILASRAADRAAVKVDSDGTLTVTPQDMLAATEFISGTLLSDTQRRRNALYEALFQGEPNEPQYPDRLTLLFWSDPVQQTIVVGDESTRRASSVLTSMPVQLQPPEPGAQVLIPSVLLPYEVVKDETGGFSSAFDNRQRQWQQRENPLITLLKFSLPSACRPFAATTGQLQLRMNAGLRQVRISVGSETELSPVATLESPAGLFTLDLTDAHLRQVAESGALYLKLDVGPLQVTEDEATSSAQDDYWRVERLLLTLGGQRSP